MQKIRYNLKLFIQDEKNFFETTTIRSVQELNQKFKQINDIYSFHNLIEQISAHISKLAFEKDKFNKFMRRLIEAICFALEKYAYDFSRTSFLVETLSTVKKEWKKVLSQEFTQVLEKKNEPNSNFVYVLSKNEYMFYLLKVSNVLIEKQIFRLIKINAINIKSLHYIKKCQLKNVWTKIYDEMLHVAKETQNQTYLKIQLITEFMKHILFQVNFCTTQGEFDIVFHKLFELAGYAFRLIKKFYSVEIFPLIQNVKKSLLKGILIFRQISSERPHRFRYLSNLVKLFDQKKLKNKKGVTISKGIALPQIGFTNQDKQPSLNPKSYAIKLALRIMATWKKVKSKKDKQAFQKQKFQLNQNHLRSLSNFRKKNKESQEREQLLVNLEKEQAFLKNKGHRSSSLQSFSNKQLPVLYNIKIRKQIQEQIDKEFGKLKYLKNYASLTQKQFYKPLAQQKGSQKSLRSNSRQRKRSISLKQTLGMQPKVLIRKNDNEEKEVNIQDYKQKLNLCRKQVNTQNRIILYHPEKRSLLPHGGQKVVTKKLSTFTHKSVLPSPSQLKQKLRL